MTPRIGEVVLHLVKGEWIADWLRMEVVGNATGVIIWGESRERYKSSDVWKERVLPEMPPLSKYTNPQSLWLKAKRGIDFEPTEIRGMDGALAWS